MATVREGTKSVLVIVDVQVAVMKEAWDSSRVISNVATIVHEARSNGVPVIWIQHSDDQLPAGSPEWELAPELLPNPDETLIHKSFASSFEETDLEKVLEDLKGSHIVLAGAVTNFCI
ncbi:MAG: isochorismatase family protein [Gammaproteobacteria bacterium]|jgi:nicotinamidase-related amidase|nr:isochorismatase family protein [Gammaproteobacteria bacterium]|tara:strand:- start:380 stop:733 length:354 start_codon:yes stop_codon:yes gene_type:complete